MLSVLATYFACFLFSGEGHYFLNSNLERATIFETVNRKRATIEGPGGKRAQVTFFDQSLFLRFKMDPACPSYHC